MRPNEFIEQWGTVGRHSGQRKRKSLEGSETAAQLERGMEIFIS